ncbi:MAG: nylA 4 [Frankiales bacterium]|nr:nylA 4 [Frankiales bacterium]
MSDLHELTALEIGAAIQSGSVSAVDVAEHFLRRISSDQVGAFVTVDADRHLGEARMLGRRPLDASPLWGVPISVKDLEPIEGQPTSLGSAAFRGYRPAASSAVVLRLQRSGLLPLGKTTTPEFGLVCYSEPDDHPGARSPWDTTRSASGSSGGAAASVGAGLVPLAQGGDGGGSIRTPASACGVVGLKPSRGRVGSGTASGDAIGLSTLGPLARTVADVAALLDVLVGGEPGDTDARQTQGSWLAAARQRTSGLRIGWFTTLVDGRRAHPACQAAVARAAEALSAAGHDLREIDNPQPPGFAAAFTTVWSTAAAAIELPPGAEDLLRPITRFMRERGRSTSGPAALQALIDVRDAGRRVVAATADFDIVLTPTLACPPVLVGALRVDDNPAEELDRIAGFTPFTPIVNASGQPAISIPVHWTDDGLPVGVQLVGRPGADGVVLALALELEGGLAWGTRRPPTW